MVHWRRRFKGGMGVIWEFGGGAKTLHKTLDLVEFTLLPFSLGPSTNMSRLLESLLGLTMRKVMKLYKFDEATLVLKLS